MDPVSFRDLFLGALGHPLSATDAAKLVFLPTPDVAKAPDSWKSPSDFFKKWVQNTKDVNVMDFYGNALKTPPNPRAETEIHALLKNAGPSLSDRLTFVILPGIFSEFLNTRTFEEVFVKKSSSYRKFWKEKFKTAKHQNPELTQDFYYSLEKRGPVCSSLADLISVSSLDDPRDGAPLFNAITFNTQKMSLETLGNIAESADTFLRRLRKFFQIAGTPKNIAFIGYSRGTPVALEMLAQAKIKNEGWLAQVRAVISLGGVLYGSELADEALNANHKHPAPLQAKQFQLLETLGENLQELPLTKGRWLSKMKTNKPILDNNSLAWIGFLKGLAGSSLKLPKLTELPRFVKHKYEKLSHFQGIDPTSAIGLFLTFWKQSFRLDKPRAQYNENIRRSKILIQALSTGIRQLSTQERLKWWKTHALPTEGIRYCALAGMMVNPQEKTELAAELSTNPLCFNPELPDDDFLKKNFTDFLLASGITLNDSQVALHKAQFWPELTQSLNPSQPPLHAAFLVL